MTNPTPSPEMPKADRTCEDQHGRFFAVWECKRLSEEQRELTTIERHAASLQTQLDEANARAERAEADFDGQANAAKYWHKNYKDKSAECERFREALETISSPPIYAGISDLSRVARAALTTDTTKETTDE